MIVIGEERFNAYYSERLEETFLESEDGEGLYLLYNGEAVDLPVGKTLRTLTKADISAMKA